MFRRRAFLVTLTFALPGWLALGLSLFVLHRPPVGITSSEAEASSPADADLDRFTLDLSRVSTFADVVAALETAAGRPVRVSWIALEAVDFIPALPIATPFPAPRLTLRETLDHLDLLLFSDKSHSEYCFDVRVFPDHIDLATRVFFDAREVQIVTYDINPLINRFAELADPLSSGRIKREDFGFEICKIVTTSIEPSVWIDGGGDVPRPTDVHGVLLVQAPARIQHRVAAFLDQLARGCYNAECPIRTPSAPSSAATSSSSISSPIRIQSPF